MSEVSQPNLIETIEKALAQAAKGGYHVGVIADEWLRALLEEVRHFKRIYMNAHVRTEELKDELSAKDKVLEFYGNSAHFGLSTFTGAEDDPDDLTSEIQEDDGQKARDILSQYRGDTHE